ncbi:MAG: hypothetical protein P0S96_01675 [Simkaniaceae bacterium]|nr:hypothetical protein [Candidatus Sacchlamyda saccharinae]
MKIEFNPTSVAFTQDPTQAEGKLKNLYVDTISSAVVDPYAMDVDVSFERALPKQAGTDSGCRSTDSGCYTSQTGCYTSQTGCYTSQSGC